MPRNIYISHGTRSEQNLLSDLVAESIKIYGHDFFYIPRKIVKLDRVLNEDTLSNFPDAYMIEMYVESSDGFEGDGKLITKFGLEIRDQMTLVVSVRRWNELVGRFGYPEESVRPHEGDLIYVPFTKGLFEIKFVEDKKPFFQLNNTPTYKLIVELFEYSDQDIDTGIDDIDDIQSYTSDGFSVLATYAPLETERLAPNENMILTFLDSTTGTCEILKTEDTEDEDVVSLYLSPITYDAGLFKPLVAGVTITGEVSGITATLTTIYDIETALDDVNFKNDSIAQNSQFQLEGNLFIDFSEANPFSE